RVIRDLLAAWGVEISAQLTDRFRRAVEEGDLPAETDPALLAKYVITIGNGVAVQAAGGTEGDILQLVVDAALRNWPPV
ncbi:TetR family transcriptional regulator, partial [Micromonospora craterilacus]